MPDPADPVFNLVSGGLTGTAPVAWGMLPAASLIVDTEQPLHAGPVTIDVAGFRAWAGDLQLNLTYMEFQLLWFLVANRGKTLTRDTILREVWGYRDHLAGERTVDVHVRRIRAKLSDLGYDLIQTMRHVGYRFMA